MSDGALLELLNLPRLSARDSIGIPGDIKHLSRFEVHHSDADTDTRSRLLLDNDIAKKIASESLTTFSDVQYDFHKVRRSVAFDSKADMIKAELRVNSGSGIQHSLDKTSHTSMKSSGRSTLDPTASTNTMTPISNPWIMGMLPFVGNHRSSSACRSDIKATSQLGLLLGVTVVCMAPQLVTRAIVAAMGLEDMATLFNWLILLSHMRALIFPIIYNLYSARLRSHSKRHLCQWHSFRVLPVTEIVVESRTDVPSPR